MRGSGRTNAGSLIGTHVLGVGTLPKWHWRFNQRANSCQAMRHSSLSARNQPYSTVLRLNTNMSTPYPPRKSWPSLRRDCTLDDIDVAGVAGGSRSRAPADSRDDEPLEPQRPSDRK